MAVLYWSERIDRLAMAIIEQRTDDALAVLKEIYPNLPDRALLEMLSKGRNAA